MNRMAMDAHVVVLCQPPNKRMQRARDPDKFVLRSNGTGLGDRGYFLLLCAQIITQYSESASLTKHRRKAPIRCAEIGGLPLIHPRRQPLHRTVVHIVAYVELHE